MLRTSLRDLTCADARPEHVGRATSLSGWVDRRRDLGQLIFLDLRDRYGITQVVVDAQESPEAHAVASAVRSEFVIRVEGAIAARLPGTRERRSCRPATWSCARRPSSVLSAAAHDAPFVINDPDAEIDESVRLTLPLPGPAPRSRSSGASSPAAASSRRSARSTTRPASSRSRRRCSSSPRRRARATSSCRRASSRATCTRCPRVPSSSSSC